MEDFLKGREVITRNADSAQKAKPAGTLPPLNRAAPAPAAESTVPASHEQTGDHGTKVETVVERGHVTRLIVTCTCGTVTEIECNAGHDSFLLDDPHSHAVLRAYLERVTA